MGQLRQWAQRDDPFATAVHGLAHLMGTNTMESELLLMSGQMAAEWHQAFPSQVILKAKADAMFEVMRFWKTHKEPGRRIALLLFSHKVRFTNTVNRKISTCALSLLLAVNQLSLPIPAVPAN